MVGSIGHVALIVRDPERTADLFAAVFDARVISQRLDDEGNPQTYARFGGVWFVLRRGDGPPVRNGDHIALEVTPDELRACAGKLAAFDVEHFMARKNTALYFMDYDNHVFELDASGSLDEALSRDSGSSSPLG